MFSKEHSYGEMIITSQPEAAVIALNEIQKLDPAARGKRLSSEMQLVSVTGQLPEAHFIFIRHIFPVQLIASLDIAVADLVALCSSFPKDKAFSLQMRCTDAVRPLALLLKTEEDLLAQGYIKDDACPVWVLSLVIHHNEVYAGVSYTADNLSSWNGGMHRLKKDDHFISRAEFKLQEALSVFAVDIQAKGAKTALDLGAAPGGWSKVLLDQGMHVTAVDPAALSDALVSHPNLVHVQSVAQKLISQKEANSRTFDLIANDMRMDMMESCKIMLDMVPLLTPGGLAVMTLKLPRSHWYKNTKRALSLLEKSYTIQGVRQLFHNRSEVTVVMTS